MNATDDGWHVGARVFVVENCYGRRAQTYWATVTSVGRKWVEYQRDGVSWRHKSARFNAETMRLDGGNYTLPGRVYRSEWEYRQWIELNKAWGALVDRLTRLSPPDGMTIEKINRFAAECGLAVKDTAERDDEVKG